MNEFGLRPRRVRTLKAFVDRPLLCLSMSAPHSHPDCSLRRSALRRLLRVFFVIFVFALLLLVFAWARWRFAPTAITYQSLDEYRAEYYEHQQAERAWEVLKQYVGREYLLTPPENSLLLDNFPPKFGDATFDEGVAFINGMQSQIAELREAAARPVLGYDYPGMTTLDTPIVFASLSVDPSSIVRRVVRLLKMDALAAIQLHDSERIVKDVDALLGYTRLMHARLSSLDTLTGNAIVFVATDVIGESARAGWPDASDQQLEHLVQAFGSVKARTSFVDELERLQHDNLQRVFTDDGDGHGRICGEGGQYLAAVTNVSEERQFGFVFSTLSSSFQWPDRAEVKAECDKVILATQTWLSRPFWERGDFQEAVPVGKLRTNDGWALSALPTLIGLASVPARSGNDATAIMSAQAARVALAAELHRRKTGALPDSLEQVRYALGGELPVDAFTGEALKYVVRDGRVLVYSVGNDRDDDGGRGLPGTDSYKAAKWCPAGDASAVVDADYVLFPQDD